MSKSIVWISDIPWVNSGLGIQSKIVIEHLAKHGHKITYIAWYVGKAGDCTKYKIGKSEITVYFLGEKSFGETRQVAEILDKVSPDIIVSYGDLHMVKALFVLDRSWKDKWVHWWTVDMAILQQPTLDLLKMIPRIVSVTEFGAKTIFKYTGRQVPVIGHTYQGELASIPPKRHDARGEFNIQDDDVVIGCVARNIWRKNLHALINSFAIATKECKNIKLLIHTDVLDQINGGCDIQQAIKDLGVSGKVLVSQGDVVTRDMAKIYDIMDFHAISSYAEGFGVPVVESMARGIPNIVPDHTTLPEIVGDSGYVVPLSASGNLHPLGKQEFFGPCQFKFADAIIKAHRTKTENSQEYDALSTRAKTMAEKYTPSKIVLAWNRLIDNFSSLQFVEPKSQPPFKRKRKFSKSKRKALLCSMFYPPSVFGGGEYTIHELMKGLVVRGWDVQVLTLFEGIEGTRGKPLPDKEIVHEGVKILQSGKQWHEHLVDILKNDPPDILITYEIYLWYSLRFLREAKRYNVKTAVYEQYWRYLTTDFNNIAEQPSCPPPHGLESIGLVDALIVNSEFSHSMFKKHLNKEAEIVYPPMTFLAKNKPSKTGEFITMIAPSKDKGVDTVFYLADNLPNTMFKLVGAIGEDETYLNIKKYPNIVYQPTTDDMDSVYREAKIVLFTSFLDESFGRVPVEAMSYGLPVIARDVGAVNGVVENYATVIPKDAGNDVWLDAVNKILNAPETANKNSTKIHDFVKSKFNPEMQCDKFAKILKETINEPPVTFSQPSAKIISVCDSGFFSVDSAMRMTEHYHKDRIRHCSISAHTGKDQIVDVLQYIDANNASVVVYGGWNNSYASIIKRIKSLRPQVKHVVNWHSPLAQIEMCNEVTPFIICNNMLNNKEIELILVPFQKDAELFKGSYHPNYRWFPDTMVPLECTPCIKKDNSFKIGFFALPSARKNILSQLSAARLLHLSTKEAKDSPWDGVKLFIGNGFDQHKDYFNFLQMLNIPYELLPHLGNKQAYYNHLGSMDLNIQITFSEAFNYVCAESLALGVPCLGSLMTPALTSPIKEIQNILDKFMIVTRIDDTISVFNKMKLFINLPDNLRNEIAETCKAHIRFLAIHHNTAIKAVIDELYGL